MTPDRLCMATTGGRSALSVGSQRAISIAQSFTDSRCLSIARPASRLVGHVPVRCRFADREARSVCRTG
jgi:hypothetical protein